MEVSIVLFVAPVFSRSQVAANAVQQVAEDMCKTLKAVEAPASIGGPGTTKKVAFCASAWRGGLICVQELKSFFEGFYCHGSGGMSCFFDLLQGTSTENPQKFKIDN